MEPNTGTQPWGRWMWCFVLMMTLTPSYSCSVGARVLSQEANLSLSREHPFLTHSMGSSGACMSQLCTQEQDIGHSLNSLHRTLQKSQGNDPAYPGAMGSSMERTVAPQHEQEPTWSVPGQTEEEDRMKEPN